MEDKQVGFKTYEEFWPYYLSQHANPVNRLLHFVGTSCALGSIVLAALVSWRFVLAAPVAGYGFAWAGHFFFETNRPATFSYPLWSLRADLQMWWWTLRELSWSEGAR